MSNALPSANPPNYQSGRNEQLSMTLFGALRVQPTSGGADVSGTNPLPVTPVAGSAPLVLVPLDVSVVTTGGTAVTALLAGNRTAGGWIQNPPTATTNLGINEIGVASGTTSSGNTTFIVPGQVYELAPNSGAVSVIASDSGHQFSGMGFQ